MHVPIATTLTLAAFALVGVGGCRACGDPASDGVDAGAQPTMPRGMLVPASDAALADLPAGDAVTRLRLFAADEVAAAASGGWIELSPGTPGDTEERRDIERRRPSARFVSPDAMALLHGAFARALPGFDAFRPHLLDAEALGRLEKELAALQATWLDVGTAEAARSRYGEGSELVRSLRTDDAWRAAREALATSLDRLRAWCTELAGQGRGMWVRSL